MNTDSKILRISLSYVLNFKMVINNLSHHIMNVKYIVLIMLLQLNEMMYLI